MCKSALITGINGQDGSYLAEFLLSKGYEVHGTLRPSSFNDSSKYSFISEILDKITIHPLEIESQSGTGELIKRLTPDECYHIAGNSFDNYSFEGDFSIIGTNFNSTVYLLSAIKSYSPHTRFYFSGSSQMFGEPKSAPQNEDTPFDPRSLYGITKVASHSTLKNFRERFGIYACTGITYNHESVRRGKQFVTRKITSGLSDIYHGKKDHIELGDLSAKRDWGYAPDFARAMWMMLNNPTGPKDYVIATGITHTIEDLVRIAFSQIGYNPNDYITINEKFLRATESVPLVGDPSRIMQDLGWKPSIAFEDMIEEMVKYDLNNP